MRNLLLLFLVTSSTAFHNTPVKRDYASISGALTNVTTDLTALQYAITNFTASSDPGPFEIAQDNLVVTIQNGATAVLQSTNLSAQDATTLSAQVAQVADLANATVQAVKTRKDIFVGAGLGPAVYAGLDNAYLATLEFSHAVISRIPPNLITAATVLQDRFVSSLIDGLDAYSDQAGPNATVPTPITGTMIPTVTITQSLPSIATAFTSLTTTNIAAAAVTDTAGYGAIILAAAAAVAAAI